MYIVQYFFNTIKMNIEFFKGIIKHCLKHHSTKFF